MQGHSYDVNSVTFNHDGSILASGSYQVIKLWSMPGGELNNTLTVSHDGYQGQWFCKH